MDDKARKIAHVPRSCKNLHVSPKPQKPVSDEGDVYQNTFFMKRKEGVKAHTFVVLTHVWLIIHNGDGPNRTITTTHRSSTHRFRHFLALFNV
jgi:hypothetical protein